ncbi:hypothetical protein WISP_76658 [Willisornis vidua]|uniref:Small ribosomal subunit protein uS17 n=1 Tax=Willisornis vidua TaxID=1566151 RepID=A0ABQ9DAF4_9PASS|nr:hypothetical protein WISP_76658 [Willisornis vidua]
MERMSWLSKLTPRAGGQRAPRSASLQPPVTADPETCLMVFKNHWAQVLRILERRGTKPAPDDLSAVRNNTYQMLNLLAEDRPRGDGDRAQEDGDMACGPILEFVAAENLLERLLCWHLQGDFTEERKVHEGDHGVEQLKLYEMLISQARQPLLRHKPVLTPLLRLLSVCAEPASAPLENSLVLLLNQLCVSVAREPAILELFFHSHTDQGPANLIIFSLLIPFIHHEGARGQQARDALLLIMAMSASNRAVAQSITDNSYFCPVLATGLSALYSSLPRKIEVRGDDWHFLRREDWIGVSSLVLFMNSLEFCNAVIQVAHPLVQKQLVDYVHNGFLVPVMGPALHKTSVEEMIASTAYLDLFLRSVSETALLKTFLRFVLLHRHDNATILDTLVGRINSNSRKRGLPEEGAREVPGGPLGGDDPGVGGPGPDPRDGGTLVNGAHVAAEPGRPEGDVAVKKVRRSAQGEGEGGVGAPNGAPQVQPPSWEPLQSVDSLLEELLARTPAEPPGAGVSIEAFTEELREIEAKMRNGGVGGPPAAPPEPSEPPLSREEEEAFASFAALPEGDVGTGRAPPRPPDPLAQVVASPPRAVGPPPSQPFTGPFVSVLFGKLENMPHNSLYVNFLLTGLVAQLACYPQPLLRSFLLNTNMVFQPSVKSLLQVLGSVKNKIESFAASQEDFPALLFKAKKYLIARGRLDWADGPGATPALRRPDTLASPVCLHGNEDGGGDEVKMMRMKMRVETERAYQKQPTIFQNKKRVLLGEGGKEKLPRYYRNVGLGFKTPKEAIEGTYIDKKCPFTGNVSIRGRILSAILGLCQLSPHLFMLMGVMLNSSKPWDVQIGDIVTVGECRPLSKTVRFNVLKVTKAAGTKKQFQKF